MATTSKSASLRPRASRIEPSLQELLATTSYSRDLIKNALDAAGQEVTEKGSYRDKKLDVERSEEG